MLAEERSFFTLCLKQYNKSSELVLQQTRKKGQHNLAYISGSQTGVRGPFGVRETNFLGPRSTFQKN